MVDNSKQSCDASSNQDTNRDKVLRREVVKVSDGRLREMQAQAISFEGVGDYEYHWHWAAVVNELIALRAHETQPVASNHMSLPKELRVIADTIETNGGWHIAALKVREAASLLETTPVETTENERAALKAIRDYPGLPAVIYGVARAGLIRAVEPSEHLGAVGHLRKLGWEYNAASDSLIRIGDLPSFEPEWKCGHGFGPRDCMIEGCANYVQPKKPEAPLPLVHDPATCPVCLRTKPSLRAKSPCNCASSNSGHCVTEILNHEHFYCEKHTVKASGEQP